MAHVFSCEFYEISKNAFFAEHLWATASLGFTKWLNGKFKNGQNLETFEQTHQQLFTCSKSLIETLAEAVKYVKS